jgi:hypothetical protein
VVEHTWEGVQEEDGSLDQGIHHVDYGVDDDIAVRGNLCQRVAGLKEAHSWDAGVSVSVDEERDETHPEGGGPGGGA